ncbi:uncharacterized protein K444DRAFT_614237 [Hyaloscypha bicolor E]|uniref:Uncharacterized protein n=1 Tax=Hyaloscypha bicolor E TaxID=1095630 RepID=A0A2J6T629_9HELO|nr:uncharacterized protein K444DRAFT_614237 [Hyaloscypha bicolor E]PMD58469.1 hypothetical protein K444DRAFT_614237 [Hyaloscypha bicolor E]
MSTPTTPMAALITPAPRHKIGARDDGPLLGYFIAGSSTQTLSCGNGNLFTTSSAYGGCYGTDYVASTSTLDYGCTQATTRNGVQSGGVVTCVPGSVFWTCITQTIFATFPNISPVTNYFCGGSYSALTIYRDFPSTLSSTLTSSSSQSSSSTFTSPFSTTPTAPSPTQSTEPPHQSPSSVAWISGPVIGAVALIAFVSFAIWYIRNQRRKRSTLQEYRLSYITQQEEQKHMMGMVGSSSARNELP